MIKKALTLASAACMVLATFWPLVRGYDRESVNDAISWFWLGFALIFLRWLIVAAVRFEHIRTWGRWRTVNLAFAMVLLGADVARIRSGTLSGTLTIDPSGMAEWLIKAYVGWSALIFVGLFKAMDPDPEAWTNGDSERRGPERRNGWGKMS